jgi:hypothetical protein
MAPVKAGFSLPGIQGVVFVNIEYSMASAVESLVFPLGWTVDSLGLLAHPRFLDCDNIRLTAII